MPTLLNPITAAELAQLDLFKEDEPAALEWLAERFETRSFETGELVTKTGDPVQPPARRARKSSSNP